MTMCKPLSAYLVNVPKTSCRVQAMKEGDTFGLTDSERALFDSVTTEHVNIIGTTFEYFLQNQSKSIVDPLYDEPAERKFDGPYIIKGYFSYPEHDPSPGMEGWSSEFNATAFFPRTEFERLNLPLGSPNESDIVRVWNTAYWNQVSVDGFDIPDRGMYFSITNLKEDGVLFDTASFMGFTATLRRITQQTPERKITNNL